MSSSTVRPGGADGAVSVGSVGTIFLRVGNGHRSETPTLVVLSLVDTRGEGDGIGTSITGGRDTVILVASRGVRIAVPSVGESTLITIGVARSTTTTTGPLLSAGVYKVIVDVNAVFLTVTRVRVPLSPAVLAVTARRFREGCSDGLQIVSPWSTNRVGIVGVCGPIRPADRRKHVRVVAVVPVISGAVTIAAWNLLCMLTLEALETTRALRVIVALSDTHTKTSR